MRTIVSKFAKIGGIAGEDAQRRALASSIAFELGLPAMFMDMAGDAAASLTNGVKAIGSIAAKMPTHEAIKAWLARKWTVPTDTPNLSDTAQRIEQFFHTNMPEMDLGYTQLFQLVDLRDSSQDHFDILDTNAGITFQQLAPGAEVKIRRAITEARATVNYLSFGDGLGLLDDWLRFQQFWNVDEVVGEFRAKHYEKKAKLHYALLTAQSSGIDVAFDTDDTKTLNKAQATILRNVAGKGYGAGQNAGFVIVCAPEDMGRISKMLEATAGSLIVAYNSNAQPVQARISAVISTTEVPSNTGGYYLVLPGRKMKRGEWKDLGVESQRNIYVRCEDWVGTAQYNAAIGDTDQIRRVKFS